jgi:prevent-host-death family protein
MARGSREVAMKKVAFSEIEENLDRYLRIASEEEVVITRDGQPAGVLIGFESEEDWLDYQIEHDPRLLRRTEAARQSLKEGAGVRLEDLDE